MDGQVIIPVPSHLVWVGILAGEISEDTITMTQRLGFYITIPSKGGLLKRMFPFIFHESMFWLTKERDDSMYSTNCSFPVALLSFNAACLCVPTETRQSNREREGEPRRLNLPIHKRAAFSGEAGSSNCSCSSFSMQNEKEVYKPEVTVDMKQRFLGHCNMGTDIKQASFLGQKGEYIASGSDDGRWFVWEKKTGRLINILLGDEAVVNCIQCHPFDSVVATSGIDNTIKIWTPSASAPSMIDGGFRGPDTAEVLEAIEGNQHRLTHFLGPLLPSELLEWPVPDSVGGSFEGVQCTQS